MYGNGARTGMVKNISKTVCRQILQDHHLALTAWIVAAAGATALGTAVCRIVAAATAQATGTTILGCA